MTADAGGSEVYGRPQRLRPLAETYAELGHTLMAHGDDFKAAEKPELAKRYHAAAVQAFQEAIREDPDAGELRLYLAEANRARGRRKEALRGYLEAARRSPRLVTTVLPRAEELIARGESPSNLRELLADTVRDAPWLQQLDDRTRTAVDAFLGRIHFAAGDYKGAIFNWQRARHEDPDALSVLEGLGEALWRDGQPEPAIEQLEQAARRADAIGDRRRQASTRLTWCRVLLDQQRYSEALSIAKEAVSLGHLTPELELVVGLCQLALGKSMPALDAADRALSHGKLAEDVHTEVEVLRARAHLELRHYREATEAADRALQRSPAHTFAIRVKAQALLEGELDVYRGIRLLQVYTEQQPTDLEAHRLLLRALRDTGQPAVDLVVVLRRIVTVAPEDERPEFQLQLAEACLGTGLAIEAMDVLMEAADPDPERRSARWWRLRLEASVQAADLSAAHESYDQYRRLGETDLVLVRRYGDLLAQAGDHEAAAEVWRILIESTPLDADVHLRLAEALRRQGDLLDARQAVDTALDLASGDALAAAYELKGELLVALEAPGQKVGEAYFMAGRNRYVIGQNQAAIELFERAAREWPDHPPINWYLADTLRVESYLPVPPYANEATVRRSRVAWDQGMSTHPPGPDHAWAYLVGARITEQELHLPGADRRAKRWEAAAYMERAILLDSSDSRHWLALAAAHRSLGNLATAQLAVNGVPEQGTHDSEAMSERTLLLFVGNALEEAQQVADELMDRQPGIWSSFLRALVLVRRERHDTALELLDSAVDAQPENPWYRHYRAICRENLLKLDQARADYGWLWKRRSEPAYDEVREIIASAGYELAILNDGGVDADLLHQATASFEQLNREAEQRGDQDADLEWGLGLCYVVRVDPETDDLRDGEERLVQALEWVRFPASLHPMAKSLEKLARLSVGWTHRQELTGVIERLQGPLRERSAAFDSTPTAEQELEHALVDRRGNRSSWAQVATQAGLGRILMARQRWGRAVSPYWWLLNEGEDQFPEAARALQALMDQLRSKGDNYVKRQQPRKALRPYLDVLAVMRRAKLGGARYEGELYSRMSFAYLLLDDGPAAREHLVEALRRYRDADVPAAGEAVGTEGLALLTSVGQYWLVDASWRELAEQPAVVPELAADITAVRGALRTYLDGAFGLVPSASEPWLPVVTPIVLQLGTGLVQSDAGPDAALFTSYIPGMRASIEVERGVQVPAPRIHPKDHLGQGHYAILLDEVTVASGAVPLGMRYCPVPAERLVELGLAREALREAPNPRTGAPGCWVRQEEVETLDVHRLETWPEEIVYVVEDLGAALRDHLGGFLGIQEVHNLLEEWGRVRVFAPVVQQILSEPLLRLRFSRILRELADSAVPITDWKEILAVVKDKGLSADNAGAILHTLQRRLGSAS
jgi:tetratricopeptide (TPR) repeat protein